jgi:hypothetical protein
MQPGLPGHYPDQRRHLTYNLPISPNLLKRNDFILIASTRVLFCLNFSLLQAIFFLIIANCMHPNSVFVLDYLINLFSTYRFVYTLKFLAQPDIPYLVHPSRRISYISIRLTSNIVTYQIAVVFRRTCRISGVGLVVHCSLLLINSWSDNRSLLCTTGSRI